MRPQTFMDLTMYFRKSSDAYWERAERQKDPEEAESCREASRSFTSAWNMLCEGAAALDKLLDLFDSGYNPCAMFCKDCNHGDCAVTQIRELVEKYRKWSVL